MAEDEPQIKDTPRQPQPSQSLKNSGEQQDFQHPQKEQSRHTVVQRHNFKGNNDTRSALERPADSQEKETNLDEEEETEPDRSSPQKRHHRSGRPEKRIIEESANDPYCE